MPFIWPTQPLLDLNLENYVMPYEEVLKLKDLASLLKVSEKTIYSMTQSGELSAFNVREQLRFSRKDTDSWIEKQKRMPADISEPDQKKSFMPLNGAFI